DDSVFLRTSTFAGPVDIHTGAGADFLGIHDSVFNGSVGVDTGAGNDRVIIAENLDAGAHFQGPVMVATGDGDDTIFILAEGDFSNGPLFAAPTTIDGGPGTDSLNDDFVANANVLAPFLTLLNIEIS